MVVMGWQLDLILEVFSNDSVKSKSKIQ